MKIAMSLTGFLRNYNKTLPTIIKFCKFYNIDMFLLFDNKENDNDIENVKNMIKNEDLTINTNKTNSLKNKCGNENMWNKIQIGYIQITNYETEKNIKYDFYIRCRYDILIESFNVNFNKLDKNILYFGQQSYNFLFGFLNSNFVKNIIKTKPDEFFISGKTNMDIFCNLYNYIKKTNNICLENHTSENQLYHFIKFNYTKTKILNIKYKWACFSEIECFNYHFIGNKIKISI